MSLLNIIFAALLLRSGAAEGPVVVAPRPTTSCSCITTVDYIGPFVVEWTISDSASCTSMGLKPTCQTTTIPAQATITRPRPPPYTSAPTTSSSEPTSTPTSTTPTSMSTTSATPSTSSTTFVEPKSSTSSSASIPIPKTAPGKRGLAYIDPRLTQPFSGPDSPVSWAYNWFSMPYSDGQPTTGFNPALEFVPILWSNAPGATSVWAANVKSCISKYGTAAVLAFNEPDQCGNGGSCIQVPDAVSAYQTYMMPLAGTVALGAPAVTNAGGSAGLTYLKDFLTACTNCHFDFFPIHWYGAASDTAGFKSHVSEAYAVVGNKPLWVTEFGTTGGSAAEVQEFLQTVSKWMDGSEMVAKYSFFMDAPGFLIEANGMELSALGEVYNSA